MEYFAQQTIKLRLTNCPAQARSAGAVLERLVSARIYGTQKIQNELNRKFTRKPNLKPPKSWLAEQ